MDLTQLADVFPPSTLLPAPALYKIYIPSFVRHSPSSNFQALQILLISIEDSVRNFRIDVNLLSSWAELKIAEYEIVWEVQPRR